MSAPLTTRPMEVSVHPAPLAVDKSALAQQFSGAAGSYDTWATAQAEIAAELVRRIPDGFGMRPNGTSSASLPEAPLIVELGCGTGLLTAHLLEHYPRARLAGIDLASGMVEHCRRHFADEPRASFVMGDVEDGRVLSALAACRARRSDSAQLPLASLIASSCVAQWFTELAATLRLWTRTLAPGGLMAFACLLEGSFCELEAAYLEALGCGFPGLPLPSSEAVPRLFRAAGLRTLRVDEATVTACYASSREALRSFRQIGAVFEGQPGHQPLGPAALRSLLARYDRRRTAQGLSPVTHRVQYIVAERPR
jgi:malonyl-CoA O-methyltransferase